MRYITLICIVSAGFLVGCSDDSNGNNKDSNNGNNGSSNNSNNSNNGENNSNNGNNGSTDPDPTCENYCKTIALHCQDEYAQFNSDAECLDYCENVAAWDTGTKGDTSGNTIACRVYHGNDAASVQPAAHCPHAGPTGENLCGTWCDNYCNLAQKNCTGSNELYVSDSDCLAACAQMNDSGQPNDTQFDTVQCRIYHLGSAAVSAPETHCPHGGEFPTSQCVGLPDTFNFRTELPSAYTRVDRMGLPAVNTALITSKDAYNAADPADDVNGDFSAEISTSLTSLHSILDDDLQGESLTPCAPADCLAAAAPLVIPDILKLDISEPAAFPNGRRPADQVMDITLALLLLDLTTHPLDLFALRPLNPAQNDLGTEGAFLTVFPYLHAPHTP